MNMPFNNSLKPVWNGHLKPMWNGIDEFKQGYEEEWVESEFPQAIESENPITVARQIFKDAFEKDEQFRESYVANIAMLLHDRYSITDWKMRNMAAKEIMEIIFDAKEIKPVTQNRKDMIGNRWEILDL